MTTCIRGTITVEVGLGLELGIAEQGVAIARRAGVKYIEVTRMTRRNGAIVLDCVHGDRVMFRGARKAVHFERAL